MPTIKNASPHPRTPKVFFFAPENSPYTIPQRYDHIPKEYPIPVAITILTTGAAIAFKRFPPK